MLKLAKSTNTEKEADSELAATESTRSFLCQSTYFVMRLTGTFETRTLTLQNSGDNTNWFTYYADDSTGTPAAQQFTATHVPSTSAAYSKLVFGSGQYFRFTVESSGAGTADIDVQIAGDVHIL